MGKKTTVKFDTTMAREAFEALISMFGNEHGVEITVAPVAVAPGWPSFSVTVPEQHLLVLLVVWLVQNGLAFDIGGETYDAHA